MPEFGQISEKKDIRRSKMRDEEMWEAPSYASEMFFLDDQSMALT